MPAIVSSSYSGTNFAPRILYIVDHYLPVFSGAVIFLSWLRNTIQKEGFQTIVLTGDRGIEGCDEPKIYRLPTVLGKHRRLSALFFALMSAPALFKLRREYDFIHTGGRRLFVYPALFMGRILGKPVIFSSVQNRVDDPGGIKNEYFGRLKNALLMNASRYVCCSRRQVEAYLNAGYPKEKVVFIPNGFDPTEYRPCDDPAEKKALRESLGLPPDEFIVSFVGAVVERKGVDLLADAWVDFQKSRGEGKLILIGPNKNENTARDVDDNFVISIQDKFSRAGIADSLIMTGWVKRPRDYLRASDAFALMSRGEGFPAALIQAMASGLPFLIWDLPDYKGYDLENGIHGYLVPPFDTDLLAERLKLLADNPEIRDEMSRQVRLLVRNFTLDRTAEAHVGLYRELDTL